jgi:hypothetical protein
MALVWLLICDTQLELDIQCRQRALVWQEEQESSKGRALGGTFILGAIRSRN